MLLAGVLHGLAFSVMGQGTAGGYAADPATGCEVWCKYPGDGVSWSGKCRNNRAEGKGTAIWSENGAEAERYVGAMKNGKADGQGKSLFPDGRKLEGHFADGEFLDLDPASLKRLVKNPLAVVDSTDLYVSDGNSKALFYYSLVPAKGSKGVLVLLPAAWETVEHAISSTKDLCREALENGLVVLYPSINQHIVLTDANREFLNAVFRDAIARYGLPADRFVLGGLSMGGHLSVRYAELALEDRSKTVVVPRAVIDVDGPTDLETLYRNCQRGLAGGRSANKGEGNYVISELEHSTGGVPDSVRAQYVRFSIYSRSESDGGSARFLTHLPVRIYNDVDVSWWITNRASDLYSMNALDQSAMINFLNGIGNRKAEFINALGKGYRIEGNRHPHSWSIVEPVDCIAWIRGCLAGPSE